MKILLSNDVLKYIKNLFENKELFIDKLTILENQEKRADIEKLNGVIELSKGQDIEFFGYEIIDSIFAVFAFNKNRLIVVDLIELKDNTIRSIIPSSTNSRHKTQNNTTKTSTAST